jgi:hypothetical protein
MSLMISVRTLEEGSVFGAIGCEGRPGDEGGRNLGVLRLLSSQLVRFVADGSEPDGGGG